MVKVYLEKYGKVLVAKLPDKKADAVLDYVCIEGRGAVLRCKSEDLFNEESKQEVA